MLTRCPQCATAFRVTPEQLRARQGRVRCGACQEVFSALDTLIETVPLPPVPAAAPPPAPEPELEPEPEPEPEPEFTPEPQDEGQEVGGEIAPLEPPAGAAPAVEAVAAAPEPVAPPAPPLEPLLHEKPRRRRWPWLFGIVPALILLATQAALNFRTEIGVLYPAAKPLFATACAALGCEMALPRHANLIGIETSDLYPDAAGKLTLAATLKNRAPFAQQYPDLELTLTDAADRALVRRVLAPAAYLPPQTAIAAGLGTNADLAVTLAVDAPGIAAVGYRLYLFYP